MVWLIAALLSCLLLMHYDEGQQALLQQGKRIDASVFEMLQSGKIRLADLHLSASLRAGAQEHRPREPAFAGVDATLLHHVP